jgi:hypothetical protein
MNESMIPDTVKIPPMMAQIPVKKLANDLRVSVNFTIIGDNSYMKKTPEKKHKAKLVSLFPFFACCDWSTWQSLVWIINRLEVFSDAELVGVDDGSAESVIIGGNNLDEILVHSSRRSRSLFRLGDSVQGIDHSRVLFSKGKPIDCVRQIEARRSAFQGHQIVDMHVVLLEALSRGKVEVSCHLWF